ncbi:MULTISPECIES: alpha/beta hydrolase [Niastella]|uniref:Alpha/beta hydrolase n=1 Tax=Niastella soli TaxID=2821487 RepID=A0ABS3YM63_9BACT|nr:alpha/beta hydrolase [Niastella soli]MBO9198687.1 alpha/beta hydrolase [Niastella soli]
MFSFKQIMSAVMLAAVIFLFSLPVQSQQVSKGVKNIVLVHGAFADGSSWAKVIPVLRAKGYNVIAVQNPLTSLADDVAATKRVIALMDGPVLLVAHSYGGVVISEAGNDPKVAGLLYVCALVPEDGQSAEDVTKRVPPAPGSGEFRPDSFGFLTISSKGIHNYFAQDLSPNEREVVFATQVPWAIKGTAEKITTAAWKNKPSWMVIGLNDQTVPPALQQQEAKMTKATVIELKSSHVPMLSQPDKVSAFIIKAAGTL